MGYQKNWIEKNMGISRKTLLTYEKCGLINPVRNPDNGKYREFNEEELERIWHIKFFVELGYSLKEIKDMFGNPDFDFHKSIGDKLEKLEAKKSQLEQLIGLAKFIKTTGIFPSVPKRMGAVKFEDFLKYSYEYLNVDADAELTEVYKMLNQTLANPDFKWNAEKAKQLRENIILQPESDWNTEDFYRMIEPFKALFQELDIESLVTIYSYWTELASLSHYDVSHPDVQSVVKKLYEFEKKALFHEFSDTITPQWYAQHVPSYFSGSDIAVINERNLGKENCEFIIRAINHFGGYKE